MAILNVLKKMAFFLAATQCFAESYSIDTSKISSASLVDFTLEPNQEYIIECKRPNNGHECLKDTINKITVSKYLSSIDPNYEEQVQHIQLIIDPLPSNIVNETTGNCHIKDGVVQLVNKITTKDYPMIASLVYSGPESYRENLFFSCQVYSYDSEKNIRTPYYSIPNSLKRK
jgi:hypothetical protein